jgi:diadenosine tetraphosphate (Ap4A) HIT family hydrolase
MPDYDHWEKFKPNERRVHESESWIVVARPKQITLGSCVFLLKRPVASLANVKLDEIGELPSIAGWFESVLTKKLHAEKFNYISAMMKDPYFHVHAIPRYSQSIEFGGKSWQDQDWPSVASFADIKTTDEELSKIVDLLRD